MWWPRTIGLGRFEKVAPLQCSGRICGLNKVYRRDIALTRGDPDGIRRFNDIANYFSAEELAEYTSRAAQLNADGDGGGDRACFVLSKAE